jgi:8-oxo-dGTP pyrophosphatase MutT (NUDIX family)
MRPDQLTEADILTALRRSGDVPYTEKPLEAQHPLRLAAVLVPLVHHSDSWSLLYTRRTDRVEHHKGQVSFPGGASDPGDDGPEATALREAQEELGIRPADVRILGRLEPLVTITDFLVTPVVGIVPWPYAFRVHTPEVERVFTLPLAWLSDRRNYMKFIRSETGRHVIAYLPHDGELLWGATAHMTVGFLELLGLLQP